MKSLKFRLASWALNHLIRPYVIGFRWNVRGSDESVYTESVWVLAPSDIEIVLDPKGRAEAGGVSGA